MDVREAVARRTSVRAFKPERPSAAVVRAILEGELYVARHLYHLPMSAAYVPTHSRTQPQPLQ